MNALIIRLSLYALSAAAVAIPSLAHAQKFVEPTRDELQMTADPQAPGASAVFLYLEEVTDNRNHFQSKYARIKVLTEKGKEWGTVEVPYEPGIEAAPLIEGRTIHADGTVVRLTGKPSDLLVYKDRGFHLKTVVFNMPSVEVGSILEYRWTKPLTRAPSSRDEASYFIAAEEAAGTAEWDVQQDIYVHKAHFYFNPSNGLGDVLVGTAEAPPARWMKIWRSGYVLYKERLPQGAHVVFSIAKDYTLDIKNVPPIPHEDHAPPLDDLRYRVWFYLAPYTDAPTFWVKERERWLSELNAFAVATPELKAAAEQMVAGADTPEAKARKLYAAVQALDNTSFTPAAPETGAGRSRSTPEIRSVQDVWRLKAGAGNDLAALYLALARAAGIPAYAMQVADRSHRIFDPNYLSLVQLDALLVVVRIDGKDVYLDPGEKLCPFGQLKWTHALAGGLREDIKGTVYSPANRPGEALTARNGNLTVDEKGGIIGSISILITGPEALRWRQLSLAAGPDEVKRQFGESISSLVPPGITAEVKSVYGLDSASAAFSAVIQVSGQGGTATANRMLLPGFLFSTASSEAFVQEDKREAAVDLRYPEQVVDDVTYHFPQGFEVEGSPQPAQIPWPNHAALTVETRRSPAAIEIKQAFTRGFALLDAKDYAAMRDYFAKFAQINRQQLVLARTSVTESSPVR